MHCTYCRAVASQPFLVVERRGGPPDPQVSPASSAAELRSHGIPDEPHTKTCCPQESLPVGPPRPPPAPSCESERKSGYSEIKNNEHLITKRCCAHACLKLIL